MFIISPNTFTQHRSPNTSSRWRERGQFANQKGSDLVDCVLASGNERTKLVDIANCPNLLALGPSTIHRYPDSLVFDQAELAVTRIRVLMVPAAPAAQQSLCGQSNSTFSQDVNWTDIDQFDMVQARNCSSGQTSLGCQPPSPGQSETG
jgi:hypothetical protein